MAILKREGGSDSFEQRILTGIIMNDRFCFEVERTYKPEYFKIDNVRLIVSWVMKYFSTYGKAPGKTIRDIYEVEKEELGKTKARIVFMMMVRLSKYYKVSSFNVTYMVDKTKEYFESRSVEILFERGEKLVSSGRVPAAKKLLDDYKEVITATSMRFNPFSKESILTFRKEREENELFTFPDTLGKYLGMFERGWLVSIAGPEKRGKTWWLLETAFQAVMAGLNVVFISLEMNEYAVKERFYKRLTGCVTEKEMARLKWGGKNNYVQYPVFDCQASSDGKCKIKKGKRGVRIESHDEYSPKSKYEYCDECREKDYKRWKIGYWFDSVPISNIEVLSHSVIKKRVAAFMSMYRNNLQVRTFPRFSASFKDIDRELDDLEYAEDFTPDVVVIDYFDIMASEGGVRYGDERTPINTTWMKGGQLASSRRCCVVTGDQTTKKSRASRNITEIDTSEDKRKDAHVDMKVVLNQTNVEHNHGIMRLYLMFHRHMQTVKDLQVAVTQGLPFGQPMLDSAYLWANSDLNKQMLGGDILGGDIT